MTNNNSAKPGAYLLTDGRLRRLFEEIVFNPKTSPNGCRVAFSFAKNFNEIMIGHTGSGYRARVIDLCADKEN